ncbi:putative mitotic spindle checkpoint protein Bub1/Mad3 [Helianthus annuus]|uniref:Mitotic spindle checkpoint protein Bub1/Mad3 n=1 Tax=Helianthus annuus TaxID=4232 RepID=A0A9K3H9N4_HELAN|nr:probable inactive serine/threonine-protein kinase bub1 [Helianthus annuus]KAF5771043.1 putative mitotic spindle checkpoint protein Bub1/Mad3 [Helianthus annuus]KAJ0465901.1 putative mitotic spindle checkpoint protein Bub1/Mad3 [Helianthus annuus]KAJ0487477.1 putative mitotic spindle checkpoint protein Bub1/Mad3 [Helianthus annuus]KAJ0657916.1 putative mitotic spindle checkpoint protein Bub1/Mad3 [Helianthus annuus]KAJ0661599.1 putative mitotic spindle checkpoint protein Bub1/Mad3 [Helianthu
MANNNSTTTSDKFFSSLISDIKTYTGPDPLLPWLGGIKQMTTSLPPQLLKQKLPRFLQKCVQTFQTDLRYRNDIRYLRVWMKLLDFVDDPGAVLEHMKESHIGNKRSLFYQAYALYYEKIKKFAEAENMYHLGVQNLAEPADELQKSFDQFLLRLEKYKNKRTQRCEGRSTGNPSVKSLLKDKVPSTYLKPLKVEDEKVISQSSGGKLDEPAGENTVVVRFTKTAIVGKSKAEDARHHGLVEPTINTKEAMDAINSMFRAPLGPEPFQKHNSNKTKANDFMVFNDNDSDGRVDPSNENRKFDSNKSKANDFVVFNDNDSDGRVDPSNENRKFDSNKSKANDFVVFNDNDSDGRVDPSNKNQPVEEPFQIYCDGDDDDEEENKDRKKENFDHKTGSNITKGTFGFQHPKDVSLECSKDSESGRVLPAKFREDTVVYRFVGSTISDEPKVENVCHHGLVEPTVNLKEAMDDINSMFGKPIEFVRKRRPRKQEKPFEEKQNCSSFLILPDDESDHVQEKICKPSSSSSRNDNDLFEQTVCTKAAMDDINKMFAMPLDF